MTDFLILEYQDHIGGRMRNTKFGSDASGNPYTVELGANWISGLGEDTVNGPENPVWTFSKQVNLTSPNSDAFSIVTYNETGAVDYTDILDEFEEYWSIFEQSAGTILSENLQDRSFRAGLWQSGWRPKGDAARKAVEYYLWDWETAQVSLPCNDCVETCSHVRPVDTRGIKLRLRHHRIQPDLLWLLRG